MRVCKIKAHRTWRFNEAEMKGKCTDTYDGLAYGSHGFGMCAWLERIGGTQAQLQSASMYFRHLQYFGRCRPLKGTKQQLIKFWYTHLMPYAMFWQHMQEMYHTGKARDVDAFEENVRIDMGHFTGLLEFTGVNELCHLWKMRGKVVFDVKPLTKGGQDHVAKALVQTNVQRY